MSHAHILFICVANSARSQMAEAIARSLAPAQIDVSSAGSSPSQVNPLALRALEEVDIQSRTLHSKSVESIDLTPITHVVTLCAEEVCPIIDSNAQRLAWTYPDPASAGDDEGERLEAFRAVRDHLLERMPGFISKLSGES